MKFAICLALTSVSAIAQVFMPADTDANTPEKVLGLLSWPTNATLAYTRLPAGSTNLAPPGVVLSSERWVRLVVDLKWLPNRLEPFCIRGEPEHGDVVRYRWMKSGVSVSVAQTFSIFALEIRPECGIPWNGSKEHRLESVRKVCLEVLRRTGARPDFQGGEIETPDFNSALMDFSFSAATTQEITNSVARLTGRPKTMGEEGVKQLEAIEDVLADGERWKKPGWEKTNLAWGFWFRHVYWIGDRERIIVYFPKAEAGPQPLSFGDTRDKRWFGK